MIGCQQGSALEGSCCAKFTRPQKKEKEKQPESLLMEKFEVELMRIFWITEVKTLLPHSIGNKFVSLYFQK